MHIILVSNRLATARTLNITPKLVISCVCAFVFLSFATSFLFSWIGVRFNMPFAAELVASVQEIQNRKTQEYLKDNISSMAVKLGEMQAQLMRLDMIGERVSKLSGLSSAKKESPEKPGQGGPLIVSPQPLQANELQREIDRLSISVEDRLDALTAIESQLMERRIKSTLLPTLMPINGANIGSTFGRRIDPFVGIGAMHEGIDFVADQGTPVFAAAGGIVTTSEMHPQYGILIEIDHGNDFSSRYAHLSKTDVKEGQIVKRGQRIAASGNTGRSTGPHLHFEIRFKGAPQNPARFLNQDNALALNATRPANKRTATSSARPGQPAAAR